jgi:hypothetical protein
MRQLLLLCAIYLTLPLAGIAATDYYVDNTNPSASDSNAGTNPSLPWRTIGKAANTLVAGDKVTVLAGGSYDERVVPTNSGTAVNAITYNAGPGIMPKVRGFSLSGRSYITIKGFEITNTGFSSDVNNPAIFVTGTTGVKILNNYIHDTILQGIRSNPNVNGAKSINLHIQGNTLAYIGPSGARENMIQIWGDGTLIEGNELSHGEDYIRVYGNHIVVRNNTMHNSVESETQGGHIDAVQSHCAGTNPAPEAANFLLLEGNYHRDNPDFNSHFAVINATNTCGGTKTVIVRHNAIVNLGGASAYISDTASNFGDHHKFYNNTMVNGNIAQTPKTSSTAVDLRGISSASVINNIFVDAVRTTNSPGVYVLDNTGTGTTDYNFAYTTSGTISWGNPINTEPHRILNQNPLFVSSTDFRLQPGSPARAAGGPLTTVHSSDTGTGTSLAVTDAHFFQDGWAGTTPDWIAIGNSSNIVQISSIDYNTNTIALAQSVTRSAGQPVWLYMNSSGSRVLYSSSPDMGAFPSGGPDTAPPVPGNSGAITTSDVDGTSFALHWTKGTDNGSFPFELAYEVRLSTSNNIGTVVDAETNGTVVQAYTSDISSFTVTGRNPLTTYYATVIVKDEAGNKAVYATVSVTTPLMVSPVTLPYAILGTAYSQTITASGGVGPYTFTVVSGSLPAGFTLNSSTGALTGTPGTAGSAIFSVRATDSLGSTGQRTYVLEVTSEVSGTITQTILGTSFDSTPIPGFAGRFTINVSFQNQGESIGGPMFFKITQLAKIGTDQQPSQPNKLLSADNQDGVVGDIQSISTDTLSTGQSASSTFLVGLGSRQTFRISVALFAVPLVSLMTADTAGLKAADAVPPGSRLLKTFDFEVTEAALNAMSSRAKIDPLASDNVGVITGPGAQSRAAVAIDPVLPRRMAVAANDSSGNVVVKTSEDGGTTWHSETMSRSANGLDFFNAQGPSIAYDSNGILSVVYVLSNLNDAANALVISESIDGINFNPPYAISFHPAAENVFDSRPVVAISRHGRYVAWENFGSAIHIVRSEEGGLFGAPVTVVSGSQVSAPTIAIGKSAVHVGWNEWGFNSAPPFRTGGRLLMASSLHAPQLSFGSTMEIARTGIGFASPGIPALPVPPFGVSPNLTLGVDPAREHILYAAFADRGDGIDIRFARSMDWGNRWSVVSVKGGAAAGDQFSPGMDVDSTGDVYISFYDSLVPGSTKAHVFVSRFSDRQSPPSLPDKQLTFPAIQAGPRGRSRNTSSFAYQQITTVSVDESRSNLGSEIATNLGDRTAIAVSTGSVRAGGLRLIVAWTDTRQRTEDIYFNILSVRQW